MDAYSPLGLPPTSRFLWTGAPFHKLKKILFFWKIIGNIFGSSIALTIESGFLVKKWLLWRLSNGVSQVLSWANLIRATQN